MDHRKIKERFLSRSGVVAGLRAVAVLVAAVLVFGAAARFGSSMAFAQSISLFGTVEPSSTLSLPVENSYRWYANVDAIDPVSPLAAEAASAETPSIGSAVRLRMNVENIGGVAIGAGTTFALQYANSTAGPWSNVGGSGAAWGFTTNPSVPDGSIVTTLLLSSSTVGESYDSSNPSAAMPYGISSSSYGEWDWSLSNMSATTSAGWYFRMIYASGTLLSGYDVYPALAAVPQPSSTPSSGGGGGGPVFYVGPGGSTGPLHASSSVSTSSAPTSAVPVAPVPPVVPTACPMAKIGDFDCDGKVNMVDLSILLYYYGVSGPTIAEYDLNGDGTVDFADVSILMYYWTGITF